MGRPQEECSPKIPNFYILLSTKHILYFILIIRHLTQEEYYWVNIILLSIMSKEGPSTRVDPSVKQYKITDNYFIVSQLIWVVVRQKFSYHKFKYTLEILSMVLLKRFYQFLY